MGSGRMLVATDVRLRCGEDGVLLTTHPAALASVFEPLTQVSEGVTLFAREASLDRPTVGRANGPGIEFSLVPDFASPAALVRALPSTVVRAFREVARHDVVFGRIPEPLSILVGWAAVLRKRPFVANVVADPTNPRLSRHRLGSLLDRAVLAAVRALVRRSTATVFVTERYLQERCPPPAGRPQLVRSNVTIDDSWFTQPRHSAPSRRPRIVLVGSNQSWDKGQLVLLDAAQQLHSEGLPVALTFVGGGRHTDAIGREAAARRLAGHVTVAGQVNNRADLAAVLDEHDLFCLPSLSEGLPRALVEAMARGLPAVGSTAGGIPELLPPDAIAPVGDASALAAAIRRIVDDPEPARRSAAAIDIARKVADRADPRHLVSFLDGLARTRPNR